jgi:hypothetical protein
MARMVVIVSQNLKEVLSFYSSFKAVSPSNVRGAVLAIFDHFLDKLAVVKKLQ